MDIIVSADGLRCIQATDTQWMGWYTHTPDARLVIGPRNRFGQVRAQKFLNEAVILPYNGRGGRQ